MKCPGISWGCLLLLLLCLAWMGDAEYIKYKDPKLPVNIRIKDLLGRMTLAEKIGQTTQIERSVASADVMRKYFIGKFCNNSSWIPVLKAQCQNVCCSASRMVTCNTTELDIPLWH